MGTSARSIPEGPLGGYRVLETLGAGGMGVVYKALDLTLRRTVALKFLTDTEWDPADKERLLHEARAASVLDHANIATIHAVERAPDGRLFLVMAFYEGETLAGKIHHGPLLPARAVGLACQVARGLQHAHAHGIVHRDIKPSNVIVTADGVAKILDFGLARHFDRSGSTQSATLSGTLQYLSPEQIKAQAVDGRTDIWSFGVLLYQLLTGRLPFARDTAAATLLAILNAPPAPMPEVPEELQLVIYRALSKSPDARYASCADLLRDLEKLQPDDSQPTAPVMHRGMREQIKSAVQAAGPPSLWRQRRWRLVVLGCILASLLGAAVWFGRTAVRSGDAKSVSSATTVPAAYQSYNAAESLLQHSYKRANLDRAIVLLEGAVASDPEFAPAFSALGEAYWGKYRLDPDPQWLKKAEPYCRRALQLNPQLPAVHVTLGRIHAANGHQDLALDEFQKALKLEPRNADAMIGTAGVYENAGRYADAEALYRQASALRPGDWRGPQALAGLYFARRQYGKAAEEDAKVIELTPDSALAHSALGLDFQEMGRLGESEKELKHSLALEPTYAAYAMLGRLYYRQKRWAEAVPMMEEAAKLNRSDYRVWANLAPAYEWIGAHDKASAAYEQELLLLQQVAQLKPDDAGIESETGLLYARKGLRKQALALTAAALARVPQDPQVLVNAAEAYESLGDRSRSLALAGKALKNGLTLDEVERNPGLRELLRDPRFRRLVNEVPRS